MAAGDAARQLEWLLATATDAGPSGLSPRALAAEAAPWASRPGVVARHVGGALVVGVDDESEIFRSVWKFYKRNAAEIANHVRSTAQQPTTTRTVLQPQCPPESETERGAPRAIGPPIPCLDFDNLDLSPPSLRALVEPVQICGAQPASDDISVSSAFTIRGRPGFTFLPKPFVNSDVEAFWASKLALTFASGGDAERNVVNGAMTGALDARLRWSTLGFHYRWKQREYSEEHCSPFPADLAKLAIDLAASVGDNIVPETAIINYYKRKATMGGHRDDAEWTDEAPVVAISFGNAGVYVLGGDGQTDEGPPPPIPVIVRNGDVVLLGGKSRMNLHGVPCMLENTLPDSFHRALLRANIPDFESGPLRLGVDRSASGSEAKERPAAMLAQYMTDTRINVNVRQVRARAAALRAARRVLHP